MLLAPFIMLLSKSDSERQQKNIQDTSAWM